MTNTNFCVDNIMVYQFYIQSMCLFLVLFYFYFSFMESQIFCSLPSVYNVSHTTEY